MQRPKIIAPVSVLVGLMFVSTAPCATAKTAEDPGASAVLGTIYFSSVLDDAGIGSGHSGGPLAGGRPSIRFRGNPTEGSNAGLTRQPGDGSEPGKTSLEDVAAGSDPVSNASPLGGNEFGNTIPEDVGVGSGPSSNAPGGSDRTTEIFGDITPGSGQGGPGTAGNEPSTGFPDIDGIVDELPDLGGLYPPDEIVDVPSRTAIVSSARIAPVPEPTSVALFGVGLVAVSLLTRCRKRRAAQ